MEHFTTREGILMPKMIYGTAWKKDKTAKLVEQAIKLGFRGIDTACQPKHYFEPGVGSALEALAKEGWPRKDLFIQTKFTSWGGQDPLNIPYNPNETLGNQVAQSFAVSQKNLRTDYVDSLVLHSPMDTHKKTMEVWQAMEKIYHKGGAKQLGLSNCYDLEAFKKICADAEIKPAVLQNRFYKATGFDQGLRSFCLENQVIYQSFWTLSANPDLLARKPVIDMARDLYVSPEQILFRFLTQIGVAPLTGTTSEEHMKQDLAIFGFELNSKQREQIHELIAM